MLDLLERSSFLNRISSLQRLCSENDKNFPKALLFIPGQDGRNNKGSVTILKYLMRGSVSKDLTDETLDPAFEPLEELVLLIRQTSVSVIWSHEMKRLLSPLFEIIPHLIEYLYSAEDETEIDLMQARKCCDFKRMMLESVGPEEGVGIPIPIGYDDIQDIESWPLLQSFALDHVYCPTGFFTARYNVADITTHLEVLFRTVDGYYVDNAVRTMQQSIGPHMMQAICMLDAATADQRMRVTADDAVGPLEILYDFGEMDTAGTIDATTRPIVLFGPDTVLFGSSSTLADNVTSSDAVWRNKAAGKSLHVIMEGCEPSTGLRWCRTYILQRGRIADISCIGGNMMEMNYHDNDGEEKYEDYYDSSMGDSKTASSHSSSSNATLYDIDHRLVAVLYRLEAIYIKLTICMRYVVQAAFAKHSDVLEAGTEVQQNMDLIMKGLRGMDSYEGDEDSLLLQQLQPLLQQDIWKDLQLDAHELDLLSTEQLQVHMDCMNAVGEIVTIEDVDDMGGSCWTYIRVAVHGINCYDSSDSLCYPATVAVGDTFLFSSHRSTIHTIVRKEEQQDSTTSMSRLQHQQEMVLLLQNDGCCITHALPYYRCFLAAGAEERSSKRLLACTRSTHMLSNLGLGKAIVDSYHHSSGSSSSAAAGAAVDSSSLSLMLLTDHSIVPFFEGELRPYTEGFVIEKMNDTACLPLLVSIGKHVDRVWSVDTAEVMTQAIAARILPPVDYLQDRSLPDIDVPSGVLIIFRLKAEAAVGGGGVDGDTIEEKKEEDSMELNPLQRSLPLVGCSNASTTASLSSVTKHLAILVQTGSRAAASVTAACSHWRSAMRLHGVLEHRGSGGVGLPAGILRSFLAVLDHWSEGVPSAAASVRGIDAVLRGSSNNAADIGTRGGGEGLLSSTSRLTVPLQAASYRALLTTALCYSSRDGPTIQLPGAGYYAMRCVHSVSEAQRLSLYPFHSNTTTTSTTTMDKDERMSSSVIQQEDSINENRQLLILLGYPGSGITIVANQLVLQLTDALPKIAVETVDLDFSQLLSSGNINHNIQESKSSDDHASTTTAAAFVAELKQKLSPSTTHSTHPPSSRQKESLLVVTVLLSAAHHVPVIAELVALLSLHSRCDSASTVVVSVSTPCMLGFETDSIEFQSKQDKLFSYAGMLFDDSGYGVGQEYWRSIARTVLHGSCCDVAVMVDDSSSPIVTDTSSLDAAKKPVKQQSSNLWISKQTTTTTANNNNSSSSSTASNTSGSNNAYQMSLDYLRTVNTSVTTEPSSGDLLSDSSNAGTTATTAASVVAIIRLQSPSQLRLDPDSLESIVNLLQTRRMRCSSINNARQQQQRYANIVVSERQACVLSMGMPSSAQLVKLFRTDKANIPCYHNLTSAVPHRNETLDVIKSSITVVRLTTGSATVHWDIQNVIQTLQRLFPVAKQQLASTTAAVVCANTWKVPTTTEQQPQQPMRAMQRLIQLAKAKVLTMRQYKEGRARYETNMQALLGSDDRIPSTATSSSTAATKKKMVSVLQRLIRGICTVHGVLQLPGGQKPSAAAPNGGSGNSKQLVSVAASEVLLEASSKHILLRSSNSSKTPSTNNRSSNDGSVLIVQGIFSCDEVALLKAMFELCVQHELKPRSLISAENVSVSQQLALQSSDSKYNVAYNTLPSGWWFDGQGYVNINGTRRQLRPDINCLIDSYIIDENAKIVKYNALLLGV